MKVLHYIPLLDRTDLKEQIQRYGEEAEPICYIATLWADCTCQPPERITVYQMLRKPHKYVNLIHVQNRFLQILYSTMPDIVHIHGCWSYVSAKVCEWSKKRNFKVIISPHLQLGKQVLDDHFWSKRLPHILFYQRRMIKRADALWAVDELEVKDLRRLGWNKRICMPITLNEATEGKMGYATFCQKVIDTSYYADMHEHEKAAFSALLHAGLADAEETHLLDGKAILNLRRLTVTSWRRLFLLAEDQHVRAILMDGIARMQLNAPHIDPLTIDRFTKDSDSSSSPLSDSVLVRASKRKEKRAAKISDEQTRQLYFMLENLRQLLRGKRLSMLQLSDYYQRIRHTDTDENRLMQSLDEVGLGLFAGRMHQILYESLYLEHGFMPIPPVNDRGTERIRQDIKRIY